MTNVEVEGDLEIVELYQFELVASDLSNTEAKDDSGDKERQRKTQQQRLV